MKKIEKGQHNYIDYKKKSQLIKTGLMFFIAAAVFVLGLVLNKSDRSNIFTIVAAVLILPAAKFMVNLIIMIPYHSVEQKTYEHIINSIEGCDKIYTDIVMTSPQKIMNLAFLVVKGNQVLGLVIRSKEKPDYIQSYLRTEFKLRNYQGTIRILNNEKEWIAKVNQATKSDQKEEHQKWYEYLESLMV